MPVIISMARETCAVNMIDALYNLAKAVNDFSPQKMALEYDRLYFCLTVARTCTVNT
jgi:hypothetical protein